MDGQLLRRKFLISLPVMAAPPKARVRRELFLKAPGKGVAVMCNAYYTRRQGGEMLSIEQRFSRSDTVDVAMYRRSTDYGRTWSQPEARVRGEKRAGGMWRLHPRGPWVEPRTGRLIEFWVEGVLPSDDPLEGMRQWNVHYRVGLDGASKQVIHIGHEYDAAHPLPGVWTGKNSVMIGDNPSRPISRRDGAILLPVVVSPLGSGGKLYNPTGGYTYHDAVILIGRWKGNELAWEASERIAGDPERVTRGMDEPTLATLDDGRILCVLRGSNDSRPHYPAHKWAAWSSDGGVRWTKPVPWTYTSGERFFSPSSCSQLLEHSSGRIFWLGNINPENPRGNRPRYPFVIGEVDRRSGLLAADSVRVVDDREPGDDAILTLSNFFAREDRRTKEVALHMSRLFAFKDGWVGDGMLYRIAV
jgi:hypothetical protein